MTWSTPTLSGKRTDLICQWSTQSCRFNYFSLYYCLYCVLSVSYSLPLLCYLPQWLLRKRNGNSYQIIKLLCFLSPTSLLCSYNMNSFLIRLLLSYVSLSSKQSRTPSTRPLFIANTRLAPSAAPALHEPPPASSCLLYSTSLAVETTQHTSLIFYCLCLLQPALLGKEGKKKESGGGGSGGCREGTPPLSPTWYFSPPLQFALFLLWFSITLTQNEVTSSSLRFPHVRPPSRT